MTGIGIALATLALQCGYACAKRHSGIAIGHCALRTRKRASLRSRDASMSCGSSWLCERRDCAHFVAVAMLLWMCLGT